MFLPVCLQELVTPSSSSMRSQGFLWSEVLALERTRPSGQRQTSSDSSHWLSAKDKLLAVHLTCLADVARIVAELKQMEKQVVEYRQLRQKSHPVAQSAVPVELARAQLEQGSDIANRFYWPPATAHHRATLMECSFVRQGRFFKKSLKERNVREDVLFLFSDLIVIARSSLYFVDSNEPGRKLLVMVAVVPIYRCLVFDLEDTEAKRNNSFQITRTDGRGRKPCTTIAAASATEKTQWIDLIHTTALHFPFQRYVFEQLLLNECFL